MCGIVGIIDLEREFISSDFLEAMNQVMYNRGPDGEGHFFEKNIAMAMRRLSIIDLTGGWQPFYSRNDEVVAFQNGEIYNHKALQRELESAGFEFKSHSDTEVLAHGFTQWGIKGLLERLDGMFAIAIFDRPKRKLYIARDRFGEKPLYYCYKKGKFAYGSDMVSLAALPWVNDEFNYTSLSRYVALHYVPGEATLFQDINKILPGHYAEITVNNPIPQIEQYFSLQGRKIQGKSDEQLLQLLHEAVESRLVSDVPVGVFLSGGLDSSIVAAIAAKHQPNICTFSMGFDSQSHDESEYATLVAKTIGSTHFSFKFNENSFIDLLPKVAGSLDEPIGDQALLPLYWLCQEAKNHVTVALAGEGADEIFAGYGYYRSFLQNKTLKDKLKMWLGRSTDKEEMLQRIISNPVPITPSGFPLLTDMEGRKRLIPGIPINDPDRWEQNLMSLLAKTDNKLQRASLADLYTWLPDDLLVKFDRMAMSHSLEGRAPFLAPSVVEAGLYLSDSQRITKESSKVALRRVAAKILPPEILERPKQGFVLPMRKWITQWFEANGSYEYYFRHKRIPGLNVDEVIRIVEEDMGHGIQRERLLFALIMLVEWYESFLRRKNEVRSTYLKYQ
ncbi:asparagine synthase (glutamine-hydrolyzing) [Bacillus sp. 3255]|uniref:asparagine synthase (glutamine-hydrolyzing) n=1 Tax=Bacillus sp. 3255 TaxID=2817904 RepID=UPI002855AB27|nr:asparagine synthase (glutamine-hydrolyzing) [Bacillus sp. 3255]MDR6878742.1 asparagine synthase (glutamine-hydrolyzing) [Bacillus sp. 3255]